MPLAPAGRPVVPAASASVSYVPEQEVELQPVVATGDDDAPTEMMSASDSEHSTVVQPKTAGVDVPPTRVEKAIGARIRSNRLGGTAKLAEGESSEAGPATTPTRLERLIGARIHTSTRPPSARPPRAEGEEKPPSRLERIIGARINT